MPDRNRALYVLPSCLLSLTLAALPFPSAAQSVQPLDTRAGTTSLIATSEPTVAGPLPSTAAGDVASSSNSRTSTEAPLELPLEARAAAPAEPPPPEFNRGTRPFSAVAVGVKFGIAGIGFDVATPLAQRFNLRGGASFFNYSDNINVDGTSVDGELKFRSVNMSLDWFPFNNSFRISPGVILYNGNNFNAAAMVPGGQTFTLENTTYTSSTSDPVHGTAALLFGNRTAPSLTVGTGNMIPRHGGHISVPFEIGFEYITSPTFQLALAGTACSNGVCQPTSNAQFQSNLTAEQQEINDDIAPLRIYPIVSLGVAYKF